MAKLVNLTLFRLAPEVARAQRGPTGRVAKVMAYLLVHGRGARNARTALDYLRAVEPNLIWRLRDDLLALPEAERHDELERRVARLNRAVRRAIAACRRRWAMPLVHVPEDGFYLDVPDEPAECDELREARGAMPRDVAARFDAGLERLAELAQSLDDSADHGTRAVDSQPVNRAHRRWGLRPRIYGQDDGVWELQSEYNRLLTRLTGAARRWQPQDDVSTHKPADVRNG